MFRRAAAVFAVLSLTAPTLAQAAGFFDVAGTRYVDAYSYLSSKGAVTGYPDGSGRPYDPLTRAEALKVILSLNPALSARVAWYRQHLSPLSLFLDTDQVSWYAPYLEAGFESDIITGYPDRTFHPAEGLKAEEALALIARSYRQSASSSSVSSDWYAPYVEVAREKNLLSPAENLYAGQDVTRGQFFDMVYRIETVQNQHLAAFVDATGSAPSSVPVYTPQPQNPTPQPQHPVSQPPSQQPVPSTPPAQPTGNPEYLQYLSQKPFAITIPRLGILDLTVTHPGDALSSKGLLSVLKDGVGHLFGYPGGGAKIMIYGHSSGYSWDVSKYTKIFRKVNELRAGALVYVTYNGSLYVYQVTYQQPIVPNDIRPFNGKAEELILFTCWPPDSIKKRLIVHAVPVS